MTIQQCIYILEIHNTGSFSEAARKLFVAQSSLSSSVKGLEDELGIKIFERSKNGAVLTVEGAELTKLSNLELYVKQGYLFFEYVPEVLSDTELLLRIPVEDAMKLRTSPVQLQLAFTDEAGNPGATDVVGVSVEELLKEAGYDPT